MYTSSPSFCSSSEFSSGSLAISSDVFPDARAGIHSQHRRIQPPIVTSLLPMWPLFVAMTIPLPYEAVTSSNNVRFRSSERRNEAPTCTEVVMQSWHRSHASFALYSQTKVRKRLSPVSHYLCGHAKVPFRTEAHIYIYVYVTEFAKRDHFGAL